MTFDPNSLVGKTTIEARLEIPKEFYIETRHIDSKMLYALVSYDNRVIVYVNSEGKIVKAESG